MAVPAPLVGGSILLILLAVDVGDVVVAAVGLVGAPRWPAMSLFFAFSESGSCAFPEKKYLDRWEKHCTFAASFSPPKPVNDGSAGRAAGHSKRDVVTAFICGR